MTVVADTMWILLFVLFAKVYHWPEKIYFYLTWSPLRLTATNYNLYIGMLLVKSL